MININADFLANVMKESFYGAKSLHVHFFSGAYPTDEEIQVTLASTVYSMSLIQGVINANGGVQQGHITYASDIRSRHDATSIMMDLASRAEEISVHANDPISYFLMVYSNTSTSHATAKNLTYSAHQIMLGSVGDIASGKDMEIAGGLFAADTVFKINDIKFNIAF